MQEKIPISADGATIKKVNKLYSLLVLTLVQCVALISNPVLPFMVIFNQLACLICFWSGQFVTHQLHNRKDILL